LDEEVGDELLGIIKGLIPASAHIQLMSVGWRARLHNTVLAALQQELNEKRLALQQANTELEQLAAQQQQQQESQQESQE